MSTDHQRAFNTAAHIYHEATGLPPGEAVQRLKDDPVLLTAISRALRDIAGVSPLADELDALFAPKEPTE